MPVAHKQSRATSLDKLPIAPLSFHLRHKQVRHWRSCRCTLIQVVSLTVGKEYALCSRSK